LLVKSVHLMVYLFFISINYYQQMPHSTNIFKEETMKFILDKYTPSRTILDIGCGCGTYSDLICSTHKNIDGIEIFEPYVNMFGLKEKYRNLFVENAITFDYKYYDLMLLGDVLEHISESDGIALIERIYDKCEDMMIAVPIGPQGVHYDNIYEIHLQDNLTNENFLAKYKGFKVFCLRYDYQIYIKDTPTNAKSPIYLDPLNLNYDEVADGLLLQYPESTVIRYKSA